MSFIAATIAYSIDLNLVNNKLYMLSVIIALFWTSTFINFLGMKASSLISMIAALVGTLLPMLFIIVLGCVWMGMGKPIQVDFTWQSFFPDLSDN